MNTLFNNVYVYDATQAKAMFGPTDVLVQGQHICAIGHEARALFSLQPGGEVIDGRSHHILLPGLINAHFHSPANHLKGSLPSMPLELFMLYESPSDAALTPSPREAYLRTMLAALEMLRSGTTSVQDDAFLMPCPTPEIIDAVMQAYADCGLRATVALDQPDLPEIDKLPYIAHGADSTLLAALKAPPAMDRDGLLGMYDYLIQRWHGAENGRLRAATSISAPQRVSVEYFQALDTLSHAHGIPLYAHILETKLQRTLATEQPRFKGRSLVQYTADLGLLSPRLNIIHAVWVDDADLERIAKAGSTIVHNPNSNLRLGSGVAPLRRMLDFGIPVALGSDEAICDDATNMWGVVKTAGLIHNICGLDSTQWPSAKEILRILWQGGAAAMLRSAELGVVREGALADLVLLDLHSPAFTPFNDLRGQLVYCESGNSVKLTMVDGCIVFRNGRVCNVDEQALLDEARTLFASKLHHIERARSKGKSLHASYQAMQRRAAAADVGINRWVGN
jgi:5-methylthioadenosine/S-adenosylhomocysteine deaminase